MNGTITELGLNSYLVDETKPQYSFFKHSYVNTQKYARETRRLEFQGNLDFGKRTSVRIDKTGKYGDLVKNMALSIKLPDVSSLVTSTGSAVGYTNSVGNAIIKEIVLRIGSNDVVTIPGEWLDIWSSLSVIGGKQDHYKYQVKDFNSQSPDNFKGGYVTVPLFFWFCDYMNINSRGNMAMTLPLVALNKAEVEVVVELRTVSELLVYEDSSTLSTSQLAGLSIDIAELLVDYYILPAEERTKYQSIEKNQMYLISQVQYHTFSYSTGAATINANLRQFKYPISELLWVQRTNANKSAYNYFNYTSSTLSDSNRRPLYSGARIRYDGRDRTDIMRPEYYIDMEAMRLHTNTDPRKSVSCFGFGLDPELWSQPTGTCNFSYLNKPTLEITLPSGTVDGELIVFGIAYNVLVVDPKGNSWLLHDLTKSAPDTLPGNNNTDVNNNQALESFQNISSNARVPYVGDKERQTIKQKQNIARSRGGNTRH